LGGGEEGDRSPTGKTFHPERKKLRKAIVQVVKKSNAPWDMVEIFPRFS